MKLELLISALKADPDKLTESMNLASDAVLVNQCEVDDYAEKSIPQGLVRVYSSTERGVGNSRNKALYSAKDEIVLFSDDDIVYTDDYAELVIKEFEDHPEADGIFFNFRVDESRRTYCNEEFAPVTLRGSGRYPTYSLAVKRTKVTENNIRFSPLFGGGAPYSCGEDSLFIMDCLKAGLKLYKSPVFLGQEVLRESTWFKGYTEKFFFDRGVLYPFLYGRFAALLGARFIFKHKNEMCKEIKPLKAYSLLLKGIKKGKELVKEEKR